MKQFVGTVHAVLEHETSGHLLTPTGKSQHLSELPAEGTLPDLYNHYV